MSDQPTPRHSAAVGSGPDRPRGLSDEALLELVQRQTFRFFWDLAHPVSGLARDRSNVQDKYGPQAMAVGGTGFGAIAIIVAVERGWISRAEAVDQLLKLVKFLYSADSYHGVLPHFMHGETGRTIPFSRKDDGSDVVEMAFLIGGLLCVRQYFDGADPREVELRDRINLLWHQTEWDWHTRGGQHIMYWHWSPNNGWAMDFEIRGWNECLLTYVLGAASPTYPIHKEAYHRGWAMGRTFRNDREYYGIKLPLGPDFGGPLFWTQYCFMMLDPRGLKDRYADYWEQNVAHTLINREHCIRNPNGFAGYSAQCWGLTSSDNHKGYAAHQPRRDLGVISPTAALSAMPYAPEYAMEALRHFYDDRGDQLWGEYGFVDAFNPTEHWTASTWLAIDQGPIIAMIENHRTGLIWKLFMSCPEVQAGLKKLDFDSPHLAVPVA
jgi:hypothetical protein